ncbi:MAG: hypothetical protein OEY86_18335 [Nitrospira sp.]|nr:hypothetical protein [Nitrospira sp.]
MRIICAFLMAMLSTVGANAGEDNRPTGTNCDLAAPPASAGEELSHGMTMRIYPRARDIGPSYTGCQLVWIPQGNKWLTMSAVAIARGEPTRIWAPQESKPEFLACRYEHGQVVAGDSSKCPMAQFLLSESMSPGCVDKVRKAVAAGGLGAPRPAECEYE